MAGRWTVDKQWGKVAITSKINCSGIPSKCFENICRHIQRKQFEDGESIEKGIGKRI